MSACGTVTPPSILTRTVIVETPLPSECGYHPTTEEQIDPPPAPVLPPRPAATAPKEQIIAYLDARTDRAELGAVHMRRERDNARDTVARNAIPQEGCAFWYDEEMARRAEREARQRDQ